MSRIITALFALPFLYLTLVLPYYIPQYFEAKIPFIITAIVALVMALFEFFTFTKTLGLKADASIGFLGATAFFVAFIFDAPSNFPDLLSLTVALFVIAVLISQMFRYAKISDFKGLLTSCGVTILGVLYVVYLGGFLISMRVGFENQPGLSTKLLLFFFLVLMMGDVFALYTGKTVGKHKLAPKISPGKTWEGCAGGFIASLTFATIASFTFFPELKWQIALPLAAAMNVLGVLGDLAESAMKRGANAKDAARLLPGHGGLLDRLDSLLFNAPLLYYFARFYFS
ncbi:MAG: phosphatidate cytidylyltransferase [Pyrinomonadaceae bacterium]|nr:phosphatidate cytidylyltransferase [Pyrinomonadaceae bacterium]